MKYFLYVITFIIFNTLGFCDTTTVATETADAAKESQGHLMGQVIIRWIHIFAGIMWIGLLYFFNFVNGSFAATMSSDTKKLVVPELMPRALYWFSKCCWYDSK